MGRNYDTRRLLAVLVTILVAALAVVAVAQPAANAVFDRLLPLLTLILGYYFGNTPKGSSK
jgi:hypothetical protein